jgi:peptide/nickel transport system substrate-binding protein
MRKADFTRPGSLFPLVFILLLCSGCNFKAIKSGLISQPTENPGTPVASPPAATPSMPQAKRVLTVCMGQEPASLFLYSDSSQAARNIRQAIYDGPFDIVNYVLTPVILQSIPTLAAGDVKFEPVTVQPGSQIVDSTGKLVNLGEDVSYLPAGCADFSCAAKYSGQQPVTIDQQVVRFKLLPGLLWSDKAPLKADDSQFSYEVARSLYPRARADIIVRTQSYQAVDDTTVEWKGVPGYRFSGYAAAFFSPLPRHAWGSLTPEDLLASEQVNRKPLGWGPFVIDEWTPGDHISLSRNPSYFRSSEGLPYFDQLVFRFVSGADQALSALLAGECDYLDETTQIQTQSTALTEAQASNKLRLLQQAGPAWEHLDFGIVSRNATLPPFFQSKEVRQAVALCIDRQKIVAEINPAQPVVLDSYVPPENPLFDPDIKRYQFDPKAAGTLLDAAGWLDEDGNPATPRLARGVAGIADGTPFEFAFLTTDEPDKQRVGQLLQESLAQCGIKMNVTSRQAETLFAAGPDGAIFGRNFSLAQFGWMGSLEPPCYLFTSQEIPGNYPEFPKGWGGANPSGYSSPDFDRTCYRALSTLPEQPEHKAAHQLAQSIFAEDIPVIPLYLRTKMVAINPQICGVTLDPSADSALWNLENIKSGEACPK